MCSPHSQTSLQHSTTPTLRLLPLQHPPSIMTASATPLPLYSPSRYLISSFRNLKPIGQQRNCSLSIDCEWLMRNQEMKERWKKWLQAQITARSASNTSAATMSTWVWRLMCCAGSTMSSTSTLGPSAPRKNKPAAPSPNANPLPNLPAGRVLHSSLPGQQ